MVLNVQWVNEKIRKKIEKFLKTNDNGARCGGSRLAIPALWDAKAGEPPEVRSSRPAWPTNMQKMQKLARHGGRCP